jgi:hypothetical protein
MEERFRKSMRKMEGDEYNPNFFVDEINDNPSFNVESSISPQKKNKLIMQRQKEIDDMAVLIILKALDNGISLHGDRVYEEMLE